MDTFDLPGGAILYNVHPATACVGRGCPIHHPSAHHMRDWPLNWRGDGPFDIWRGFERVCPHGIGHLDPDTEAWMLANDIEPPVHGCDGCCRPPDDYAPIADAVDRAIERIEAGE